MKEDGPPCIFLHSLLSSFLPITDINIKFCTKNPEGKRPLVRLGVDGKVLLK
jgi:hypothetical protein